jgi:hypothetical protein
MRSRLIRLPLFALVLAALACTLLGSPTPTPSPAGQTPTGPTPPAALTTTPIGGTATGATPPAELTTTPISGTATGATPPAELTTTPISGTATGPAQEGENLSGTGAAETPRLAFDAQGTLHLVWKDKTAPIEAYFHRQKAANGDWSQAENLTTDFGILYPDISLLRDQGGNICVIFSAAKDGADPTTIGLYQRCQAGTTWSPAVKLAITKQTGLTLIGYSPARGTDGTVHAAFIINGGTIYFDDVQLSTADSTALGPSLAIDKAGGYHVAWISLGTAPSPATVEYRLSSDQGKTWQDAQTLSTDKNPPSGGIARLVADDAGNVHLLWEGADSNIYYRRWTPTGGWGAPAALAGDQTGPNPALAVDAKGLARVVWERSDGLPYVVQAASGTWSAPRAISHLASGEPQIVIDAAGATHVAWLANNDVYYLTVP